MMPSGSTQGVFSSTGGWASIAWTVTLPPEEFTKSSVTPRGSPFSSVITIASVFPAAMVTVVSATWESSPKRVKKTSTVSVLATI